MIRQDKLYLLSFIINSMEKHRQIERSFLYFLRSMSVIITFSWSFILQIMIFYSLTKKILCFALSSPCRIDIDDNDLDRRRSTVFQVVVLLISDQEK